MLFLLFILINLLTRAIRVVYALCELFSPFCIGHKADGIAFKPLVLVLLIYLK